MREASTLFHPLTSGKQVWKHTRSTAGGSTSTSSSSAGPLYYWVKLVRTGNVFYSYMSSDNNGTPNGWVQVGSGVTVGNTGIIGLAVTSGVKGSLKEATFDHVTITSP